MHTLKLHQLFGLLLATLCIITLPPQAQAAPKTKAKAPQAAKENLVLMSVRLGEADLPLQGAMETALLEGLQQKYQVFTGDKVDQRRREVFAKESKKGKIDCDETKCLQDIAAAFNSELLAVVSVAKQSDGYFLAINIRNLWDDKVIYSKSVPCKGCDAYAVVDKLKELVDTPAPVAVASIAEPPAPKITATDPDSVTWAEAQKGNTTDDYQVYLDAYPKGKYVAFAKAKLKKLKEAAQAAAEQQEQQLWDSVQQENSETGYARYLSAYPAGRFAGFAKTRSEKLKVDLAYKAETDLWQKAESGMDRAAVDAYLSKYPAGRYIAQASAKLQAIKEEEAKGPVMVSIPGKNYELGKYEVTQKEWQSIMGSNPSHFSRCGDNCPVEQVSWINIQEFLQKLNAKTGRQYRLPTEAEWEYACAGGNPSEYCGSSDINAVAWYKGNSDGTTHPVGQKQANGYGLYDMNGNVSEWIQDSANNIQDFHVLRSASFTNSAGFVRASFRSADHEATRDANYGFRLAITSP